MLKARMCLSRHLSLFVFSARPCYLSAWSFRTSGHIYYHDVCLIVKLRSRLSGHHKKIKRVLCVLFGLESFKIYNINMHTSLANRTSQTHQVHAKEIVTVMVFRYMNLIGKDFIFSFQFCTKV